ncbi:hypothetical protein [Aeromonas hydrophila]|uniref:hypothetical protein n=1 Tax=Aeromonas hydrophila TaxID=644 RepID=UPI0035B8ADE6
MDQMWTLGENKKATITSGLRKPLILMVPEARIEPARRERRGILNLIQLYEKTTNEKTTNEKTTNEKTTNEKTTNEKTTNSIKIK